MAPRFSLLLAAVERTPAPPCLASITAQTFTDWELCVVPAADIELPAALGEDARIRLGGRAGGGVVDALDAALAMAGGDFVGVVGEDDRLAPAALEVVERSLLADPSIDVVYTDEAVADVDGWTSGAWYKPDWSPERLRAQDYAGRLTLIRRSLVAAAGGFRREVAGAHEHDLLLRATERARRVHHVPEVLYERGAGAIAPAAGDDAARRRAVGDHLDRVGIRGSVLGGSHPGTVRVRRDVPARSVSVVIPTGGVARPVWGVQRPLIERAVRSLVEATDHPDIQVVVVVDPVTPPAIVAMLATFGVTIIEGDGPFSYARRCNQGVAASSGEQVVLLNDDMLIEQPDWLTVLTGFLAEPDVGVVGARLLYADGTLQHAGVLLNEHPMHIFSGFAVDDAGPFGLLQVDREVGAVTGACLATPRRLWDELGGLCEDFAVAFNDIDYCLRVRAIGRRVVWTPHATLYHFESQSRGLDVDPREIDLMFARWDDELHHDPYGNPNLAPRQAVWLSADDAQGRRLLRRIARRLTVGAPR